MKESNPQSPQELAARENYREAFLNVMASRGLTGEAVISILQAGCSPILEAETDELDGKIDLPPDLRESIILAVAPFRDKNTGTGAIDVHKVYLGLKGGRIDAPQICSARLICSTILFSFDEREYWPELLRIDEKGEIRSEDIRRPISNLGKRKLTPSLIDSLSSFLNYLNSREMSRISIYKGAEF